MSHDASLGLRGSLGLGAVRRSPARAGRALGAVLVAGGVLAQVAYPLLAGSWLRWATGLSVVLLAAAALVHAGLTFGPRAAVAVLLVAGGTGWAAEMVGVRTGVPFGHYAYSPLLGPQLLGVPWLVPLAWLMLGYPCLLLGRASGGAHRLRTAVVGGLALASWDLFLDPQLVAQGAWVWRHPHPSLPGVPGIPVSNFAGWVLVSVLVVALLDQVLDVVGGRETKPADDLLPAIVLAWTWAGSTLGNLVFFDRPQVTVYGGLAMGATVGPYLWRTFVRPGPQSVDRA